jgi:hypothetical protein
VRLLCRISRAPHRAPSSRPSILEPWPRGCLAWRASNYSLRSNARGPVNGAEPSDAERSGFRTLEMTQSLSDQFDVIGISPSKSRCRVLSDEQRRINAPPQEQFHLRKLSTSTQLPDVGASNSSRAREQVNKTRSTPRPMRGTRTPRRSAVTKIELNRKLVNKSSNQFRTNGSAARAGHLRSVGNTRVAAISN